MNWSLLFVPAMLVIELVFLRKWCGRFCPISAFMSLFRESNFPLRLAWHAPHEAQS